MKKTKFGFAKRMAGKSKSRAVIAVVLFLIAVSCMALYASGLASPNENAVWDHYEVGNYYSVGDTLEFGEREVSVDGNRYSAGIKLVYPNGMIVEKTPSNPSAKLSVAGQYKLRFEAKSDNNGFYSAEESFTVANKKWTVSSDRSSAEYVERTNLGVPGEWLGEKAGGILVNLAQKDEFRFNQPIDLSTITPDDDLFCGFIEPSMRGSYDFDRLVVTFTGVYNPNQKITIQFRRSPFGGGSALGVLYASAAATGQLLSGYEGSSLHQGDGFGTPYYNSFVAIDTNENPQPSNKWSFHIRYDKENQQLSFATYGGLITDFDDPIIHSKEPVFNGFDGGLVYMSVNAYDYMNTTAQFCIASVYGLEEFSSSIDTAFHDSEKPEIYVNADEDLLKAVGDRTYFAPKAVIGGKYPVPEATAFDVHSGYVKVNTNVYYNYSNKDSYLTVNVNNGRFEVDKIGEYAIVYSAVDFSGNRAEAIYYVNAVAEIDDPLEMIVHDGEAQKTADMGDTVMLAEYLTSGGSGDVVVSVTAHGNGEVMQMSGNTFRFEKAGTYQIVYEAMDYAGITVTKSYDITVNRLNRPIFSDDVTFPLYLLSCNSKMLNLLPKIYAYDYTTDQKVPVLADAIITCNGNEITVRTGEEFELDFQGQATIQYVVNKGQEGKESRSAISTVTIIDPYVENSIAFERMFDVSNAEVAKTSNGFVFSALNDGDMGFVFVNPIVAENAGIEFKGISDRSNFDSVYITFTDYNDRSIKVTVKVTNASSSSVYFAVGGQQRQLPFGFADEDYFELAYRHGNVQLNKSSLEVLKTDDGRDFNGFPSGRVYLSVQVNDAVDHAAINATRVDNQVLSLAKVDLIKPRLTVLGDYGGMHEKDSVYTVSPAVVSDTFDQGMIAYLTVKSPSGNIVTALDGTLLRDVEASVSYQIKLTEAGQYKVEYYAADTTRNRTTLVYGINILDIVAPTVKVVGNYKTTVKVGEKVTLPEVFVSDNVSDSSNIKVIRSVRDSSGRVKLLGYDYEEAEGTVVHNVYQYTFNQKGSYRFIILAIDEAGSISTVEYTVVAE